MDKKIIAILCWKFLLNWPYEDLSNTYIKCVHPLPQSGLYLAPIATALSLSSPL